MRLGALLGKSIGEVRALPAPEYHKWELYYLIEPWGWHNTEYLLGRLLAEIYHIASRGKQRFTPKQFMRELDKIELPPDLSGMTKDERKKYIRECAKRDFGIK